MTMVRFSAFVAVLTIVALGACSGDAPGTGQPAGGVPRHGGTVVIAVAEDIDAANPLVSQLATPQDFLRNALFLPLVDYGPNLEIRPVLASAWEMTGDTGVVFTLRNDVLWHDGRRTTAYDVKFTYDRATDPATAYPGAGELAFTTGAEVIDSFTIRISWQPHSDPLATFPFLPIVPEHLLGEVPASGMARADFNRSPVGNGPFRFVSHRPGERWEFEANPDFPEALGGRPYIDRLFWRPITEPSARIGELRTGGADMILNAGPDAYPGLAADPGLTGIVRETRQYALIGWNGRRAPFGDPAVRRALMMATDRQRMVDGLRGGLATLAVGPIGPFHWAYADTVTPLPFDTTAARALLADAGIEDRDGDGTLDLPDGRPFTFVLSYPSDQAFSRDVAELIASDFSAIGVRPRLESMEFGTLIGRMSSAARDFDAVVLAWASDFRVNVRDLYHSSALAGPYQIAGYANAEVDALIDAVAVTVDRDAARPLYHRLQSILRDEQPWGFLYYFPDLNVVRARLNGVEMDVRGTFVSIGRWWVSDAAAER
jgi:peptide/nickel transport system substrate-binding protein